MKHLLSSSAFLIVNKKLAFILGLKTTVYLADLISKEEYFKTNGLLIDRWFFNTAKNIQEDTTLSPHEQRNALKLLKEHNIVETKIQGIPAKTHFRINDNELLKLLSCQKIEQLDVKNFNNLELKKLTTINKNKEIRINNNINIFKDEVFSYDYNNDMLQEFFDYWTEPSKTGKLRYEMQKRGVLVEIKDLV
ncbi:MAG: hypothetical protein CM15mV105_150 [uncultured marine virus]|nr:MAG: hypothetical protein CM15mV105_150 [uncultured marine virus]